MKRLILCLICLMLSCSCALGEGVSQLYHAILNEQMENAGVQDAQALIDEQFCHEAASGAEWYVIALKQRGEYDFTEYCEALTEYLKNNNVRSKVSLQKFALSLLFIGGDRDEIASVLSETIGKQGLMSWVYGLHLLNNGIVCADVSVQDVIDKILSMQLQDGGWVITGTVSDADVTAMTVQAMAPYYDCDTKVKAAVDRAVQLLSDMQLADGSYASYGKPNAESTAQVWMALSSLGIDALADARFVKNEKTLLDGLLVYRVSDGSFCHTVGSGMNNTATSQAFLAAAACEEMRCGDGSLFILSAKESQTAESAVKQKETLGYKTVVTLAVLALAAVCCIALTVCGKRNIKNYAAIAVLALVMIAAVQFINIQSADDYYNASAVDDKVSVGTVTMSIRCDVLADKTKKAHIPADGVILEETIFRLAKDETAYDILIEAARKHTLHIESSGADGLRYVSGIANLYEYDYGDLSGWIFFINGESLSEGCDSYRLKDGDRIEWLYTCEMGNDLK